MENVSDFVMPASIAIIMFGIGLDLKFKDFKLVFTQPKAVIIGLICQVLVLPTMALALIYFWPMNPLYKIGVMLIAACPGGTASNLVTKILKGKVALSISLTAFNSFLILFSLPLIVELSFNIFGQEIQNFDLGFKETMKQVLFTVVLPVTAGIAINTLMKEKHLNKLHQPLNIILPVILIIAVITVMITDNSKLNIHYLKYLHLLFPLFLLNLITILSGFFIGKFSRLPHITSYTIAIEMGLQNSVLALFVANQLIKSQEISLIAILYGSFSLLTTFCVAYLLKKYREYKPEKI
ncbi:MAG: hypothetical protein KJO51_05455 [Gramella sp.]|nr:hypothetical protein [Christiangramia sp.]